MHNSELSQHGAAMRRLVAFFDRHAGQQSPQPGLLNEAIAELQSTIEELRVTEEELRRQNEELVRAHEQVEAERRRYQDLFVFAPDGYLVTDIHGTIQEANRAAAALLAIPDELLAGKPLAVFIATDERLPFRARLSRLSETDQAREWLVSVQPRRGAAFDASLTVSVVRDREDTVVGLRWLVRDITERKAAEEQIRVLNADLERRVAVRTAQLETANSLKEQLLNREQAARAQAEAARRRMAFLGEASLMLSASLDYPTTLATVTRLAVPALADYCLIHLLDEDQAPHLASVAHADPTREPRLHEYARRYPPEATDSHPVMAVLRTGQPEIVAEMADMWAIPTVDNAQPDLSPRDALGFTSAMVVPLVARGRTLGIISLVLARPDDVYDQSDLDMAEDLARRAALALDNARLYESRVASHESRVTS
jgi:PAS domain S-box-containing protein